MNEESQTSVGDGVRRSKRDRKRRSGTTALEKIKRSRKTGVHEDVVLEKEEDIFDYVDDRQYAKIVQQRQEDGFVLNDDGSYREHGREIFDEETDEPKEATACSKKGGAKHVARPSANVKHLLMRGSGASDKKKKEENMSIKEDALLTDILSQYKDSGASSVSRTKKSRTSYGTGSLTTTPKRRSDFALRMSSTPQCLPPQREGSTGKSRPPASRKRKFVKSPLPPGDVKDEMDSRQVVEREDGERVWEGEAGWDVEFESTENVLEMEHEMMKEEVGNAVEPSSIEESQLDVPEAAISSSGWETVREGLETTQEAFSGIPVTSGLPTRRDEGDEEVLSFFWLDAYENPYHQAGTVFLFGKVWVPEANTHVSCCVTVRNIERCLYFLPRAKVLDKCGRPTDEDVSFQSLYREVNSRYADKYRILRFTSKKVNRKYSFEKAEVPQESEYLQVRYSMEYPAPQMTDSGLTFSHVFGTNTSSLERLILMCGLKGPCWIDIKQAKCPTSQVSWCKCEAVVDSLTHITVATEQAPPPPLVVMSLSMKITVNPRTGTNEILCLGSLVHPEVFINKPPPEVPFKADLLAIRHPVDRDFPFKFDEHVKKKGFNVEVSPSERALLGYFLAKLHRVDPDILIGHNLTSFGLEVLQHRLSACLVPQWSRVSRLKRKDMPKGRNTGQLLCAGRPIVDVRTSAQELVRVKSYDLSELASTLLHVQHKPMDHEDVLRAFFSSEHLCSVIGHTMDEAMLSLRIMYELNVLPLAYQITCIAGNTMSRTLQGGRAERNEFLLLHAFTAKDYICPDKYSGQKKQPTTETLAEKNEEERGTTSGRGRGKRKPAYAGGLVLEPKRGFYDCFIVLLDFNSLYPSIIQEYNICFTTIDHAHCASAVDEDAYARLPLPDPSEPLGVLPTEIRVLVERRKQVKSLMKSTQGNKELYMQYDIRQKALKLTANSMYGCLGFPNSRFYAKPLAATVTSKGREILSHTKELALKMNLDVIYGDTDSIMINSNTRDLKEAEKMAQRVKTEVNKLYKLLEIDVDGIYKALLLLRKKKYAAVAVEWKEGKMVERRELKGLDIIRRDWSGLAKRSGHYVLDQILSGAPLDAVIEQVQAFLQGLAEELRGNAIPLPEYVITKSLTKPPSDYPDKKLLPHVQVALRMQSRGQHVQAGDVIPFVMCEGESHQSASLKAFHPDEVEKRENLIVDKAYYLQHQVHAVVSRLCEPIQGLEPALLAECLGLDSLVYRTSAPTEFTNGADANMDGDERVVDPFEGTVGLIVSCPNCHMQVDVRGSRCPHLVEGISCDICKKRLSLNSIINHLSLAMRAAVSKYYAGWLLCDDQSCCYRTRQPVIILEDSTPQCTNCGQGKLREEYPASALYRQLNAFELLFTRKDGMKDGEVYGAARDHVSYFLKQNGYSIIDLSRLFPTLI